MKLEMKRGGFKNSKALANEIGMSRQAIDFILIRRTTTFKTLTTIATALGCDGRDLLK